MPEYSPLFVTLMGIGTVFFGLICIIVLTNIMGKLFGKNEAAAAAPAAAAPASSAAPAAPANTAKQEEIIAAITAAILEDLGPRATNLRITNIKKI